MYPSFKALFHDTRIRDYTFQTFLFEFESELIEICLAKVNNLNYLVNWAVNLRLQPVKFLYVHLLRNYNLFYPLSKYQTNCLQTFNSK